jgi:hypothetical protein
MDTSAVLDGLVDLGQDDWIALWMIVEDVEAELNPGTDDETLELTITLVRGLLDRGFLAGDSPIESAVRFHAWPDQHADSITEHIRRQWREREGAPGWGDSPWFAMPAGAPRHG